MQYYISGPPMNPLARILAGLVGVLALVGAFFFGIFIFIGAADHRRAGGDDVIEAEYEVVSRSEDNE